MMPKHHDRLALGVALVCHRVGFAVLSREELVTFAVADVGRTRVTETQRLIFETGLRRRLKAHAIAYLALVPPPVLHQAFAKSAVGVLQEVARIARIPLTTLGRRDLRERHGGTYRGLTSRLVLRYPELRTRAQVLETTEAIRGTTTGREAPVWALALAIAAAEQVLGDALGHELEPPNINQS